MFELFLLFHDRFATVLYILDDVEDGGETAFPMADNSTFDDEVGKRHVSSFSIILPNTVES